MDDPALAEEPHVQALRGLTRVNRVSRSVRQIWLPIRRLLEREPQRPLRVLDLATGAGDVPIGLALRAQRARLSVEVTGCDCSPRAVEHARRNAARLGAGARFFELDVLRQEIPGGFDVLTASLFLHHLPRDDAVRLLGRMRSVAGRLVLISDLVRGIYGLALAHVGTRLVTRSPVVHVDGPRSVRAAFTVAEARVLAAEAGMCGAKIERRWPARFLLTWERPGGRGERPAAVAAATDASHNGEQHES